MLRCWPHCLHTFWCKSKPAVWLPQTGWGMPVTYLAFAQAQVKINQSPCISAEHDAQRKHKAKCTIASWRYHDAMVDFQEIIDQVNDCIHWAITFKRSERGLGRSLVLSKLLAGFLAVLIIAEVAAINLAEQRGNAVGLLMHIDALQCATKLTNSF